MKKSESYRPAWGNAKQEMVVKYEIEPNISFSNSLDILDCIPSSEYVISNVCLSNNERSPYSQSVRYDTLDEFREYFINGCDVEHANSLSFYCQNDKTRFSVTAGLGKNTIDFSCYVEKKIDFDYLAGLIEDAVKKNKINNL